MRLKKQVKGWKLVITTTVNRNQTETHELGTLLQFTSERQMWARHRRKALSCRTTRIINLCHSRGPAFVSLHHLFPERSAASSYPQLSLHALHQQPNSLQTNILIFFSSKILVHLHPFSSAFALHLLSQQFWKRWERPNSERPSFKRSFAKNATC